ncbi:hypothetical protein ANCCEY_04308 [Ancylostoma ceylanicum]|uniref:Uncharacterized protein n=1 Tax=Ancylostoma ceylanicum TaxID=53326 RepID=A0A0D6LXN0_9BILA|nr:hypothetical protein ANCCEY_04308 [Ancylostoma ceylanicum]
MGMSLREFMPNNNEVMQAIPIKDRMIRKANTVKFLGVRWNLQSDAVHLAVRMGSTAITNAQIALYWIHSKEPLESFVENRVKYIRDVVETFNLSNIQSKFYHVNTEDNPADCSTRALTASEIENHMWWSGAQFICDPPSNWPNTSLDFTAKELCIEEAVEEFKSVTSSVSVQPYESFILFRRISSFPKLVHVTAFAFKFIANLKRSVKKRHPMFKTDSHFVLNTITLSKTITSDDFAIAELLILREQ